MIARWARALISRVIREPIYPYYDHDDPQHAFDRMRAEK